MSGVSGVGVGEDLAAGVDGVALGGLGDAGTSLRGLAAGGLGALLGGGLQLVGRLLGVAFSAKFAGLGEGGGLACFAGHVDTPEQLLVMQYIFTVTKMECQ